MGCGTGSTPIITAWTGAGGGFGAGAVRGAVFGAGFGPGAAGFAAGAVGFATAGFTAAGFAGGGVGALPTGRAWPFPTLALAWGGVGFAGGAEGLGAAAVRTGAFAFAGDFITGRAGRCALRGAATRLRWAVLFAVDAGFRAAFTTFRGAALRAIGALRPAVVRLRTAVRRAEEPAFPRPLSATAFRTLGLAAFFATCTRGDGFTLEADRRPVLLRLAAAAGLAFAERFGTGLRALAVRGGAFPLRVAAVRAGRAAFFGADVRLRCAGFVRVRELAMVRTR